MRIKQSLLRIYWKLPQIWQDTIYMIYSFVFKGSRYKKYKIGSVIDFVERSSYDMITVIDKHATNIYLHMSYVDDMIEYKDDMKE